MSMVAEVVRRWTPHRPRGTDRPRRLSNRPPTVFDPALAALTHLDALLLTRAELASRLLGGKLPYRRRGRLTARVQILGDA